MTTSTNSPKTLEFLAEQLNGKLWIKGDLKRVYLDRGYNTKKMITKTYIYQREDGRFGVSCYIDCPSQPFAWIKSQQEEVINEVLEDIENALSDTVYVMLNEAGTPCDYKGEPVELNYCDFFLQEVNAQKAKSENSGYNSYQAIPRDEFNRIVEELDKKFEEQRKLELANKPVEKSSPSVEPSTTEELVCTYVVGSAYIHARFGEVTVVSEDATKIIVSTTEGHKELLKKFAKLTAI